MARRKPPTIFQDSVLLAINAKKQVKRDRAKPAGSAQLPCMPDTGRRIRQMFWLGSRRKPVKRVGNPFQGQVIHTLRIGPSRPGCQKRGVGFSAPCRVDAPITAICTRRRRSSGRRRVAACAYKSARRRSCMPCHAQPSRARRLASPLPSLSLNISSWVIACDQRRSPRSRSANASTPSANGAQDQRQPRDTAMPRND